MGRNSLLREEYISFYPPFPGRVHGLHVLPQVCIIVEAFQAYCTGYSIPLPFSVLSGSNWGGCFTHMMSRKRLTTSCQALVLALVPKSLS